ncbi:MAG: hypothetical protein UR72_C0003G0034 [Parcubacteria group bacterium GW2011_GWC1_35_21]|nr:MAG: hypothetical protein UR72_C0003G0034 [Parcubacteria group bacterium GW2011_GWC1_35_21]
MQTTSSGLRGSKLAKLTVFFIISTFLVTPLAPILAQEADIATPPLDQTIETTATVPGEVLGETTPLIDPIAPITEPASPDLPEVVDEAKEKLPKDEEPIETMALASESSLGAGLKFKLPAQSQAVVDQSTGALIYECIF